MSDIFDFSQPEALAATTQQESTNVGFNPKPAAGKDYVVVIKLLPFMKNPKHSIVNNNYHWLKDASGGFRVCSPAIPGQKCEISNRFFALREAEGKDGRCKEISLQRDYRALVQIVDDINTPENNGKIMPYRIPVKVFNLIDSHMNLTEAQIKLKKVPKDFLNPFASHNVTLTIKHTTDGRNYDATEIDTAVSAMKIDGVEVTRTPENEKIVMDKLLAVAEEFDIVDMYGYKPATDAELARAKTILVERFAMPLNVWPQIEYKASGTPQANPGTPGAPAAPAAPAAPTAEATPAQEAPAASAEAVTTDDIVNAALNGSN